LEARINILSILTHAFQINRHIFCISFFKDLLCIYPFFTDLLPVIPYNVCMDSSSLLPAMLSAYQNAIKPGQSATSSNDAKKALQDFNTMLRVSMEEQLTSMIASSNADDGSSSDLTSANDPMSSSLSGLSDISSLLNQMNTSGNTGDSNSLLNSLLSAGSSGGNSTTASMLASLLGNSAAGSSTNGALSLLSSLSGAENQMGVSALSGIAGSSNNNLSNLLSSLPGLSNTAYQQLLSRQNSSSNKTATMAMLPLDARAAHINQFEADLKSGGDGVNDDCGPTSLVMALHELGLHAAGETTSSTPGQSIDLARISMVNNPTKDGIDAQGHYSDAEHNTFTDFTEIQRGAQAAGAKTTALNASASDIMHALQEGGRVVASGTFVGKSPLPWTGDRGFDNQTAPGNATGHFVEVSSYDTFTKLFTINDPARSAPHQVSAATLDYFMSGNAGAMAVRA
jgi:hypothetical protein